MNHHIIKGTRVLVHAASFSSGCEGPFMPRFGSQNSGTILDPLLMVVVLFLHHPFGQYPFDPT